MTLAVPAALRRAAAAVILWLAVAPGLAAQEDARPAFLTAVERALDTAILPAADRLAEAAADQRAAVTSLCDAPAPEELASAREAFGALVDAFSRFELYRMGPAREDNRFERLFFWPDRRGRGLAQVQALIAADDPDIGSLQEKSVAVQGLLALDVVLAGEGSTVLAKMPPGGRCRYGAAVADAIAGTAAAIRDGWRAPDGFAATMRDAGPDNALYRTHGEATRELLQAAAQELSIVRDLKLAAVVGETPGQARPRLAPFWRSGNAIASVVANIEGVAELAATVTPLLGEDDRWLADSLAFELRRAREVLASVAADPRPFEEVVTDPEAHRRLVYAQIPLAGALTIVEQRMPAALGLVMGFNALDGD